MRLAGDRRLHVFADRVAAGRELARELERRALRPPLIVLGLPRGGVAVAQPVAHALHAPLDALVVRKVGMPGQPELAMGAIATGNIVVRETRPDHRWYRAGAQPRDMFERVAAAERRELERREALYRAGRPPLDLQGKTAILVDDGLATGATMIAAIRAARKADATSVIVAAPVASAEAIARVGAEADETVVLTVPEALMSIGEWYDRFEQLSDAEVTHILTRAPTENE